MKIKLCTLFHENALYISLLLLKQQRNMPSEIYYHIELQLGI
jgi:hypothetical protein